MICVGLRRSRGVLLEACNSVKNGSLGARRELCAYVRVGGLNKRVGLPAITVRGLFSKPPTGTQGLPKDVKQQNRTTLVGIARRFLKPPSYLSNFQLYLASAAIGTIGLSYAAVPLYRYFIFLCDSLHHPFQPHKTFHLRVFCQSTGFGGTIKEGHDITKVIKSAMCWKI